MNRTLTLIIVALVAYYVGQNFPGALPRLPISMPG